MKEVNGIISREELEAYGGTNIMLMDARNNSTDSGKVVVVGEGYYEFSFTYDVNTGFIGLGWVAAGIDFERDYPDPDERDEKIEYYKKFIMSDFEASIKHEQAGCCSWTEI